MSNSLPERPSLENLKRQAKDVVKAHARGDGSACEVLRLLPAFAGSDDSQILAAKLKLSDAQYAVAMSYGFESWKALKARVEEISGVEVRPKALQRLSKAKFGDAPIYLSQMVRGYVQALNSAGTKIDNAEFAAATGWSFSFSYRYDDFSPAFLALRGDPKADGPYEIFRFLPEALGYEYEGVPVEEKDRLWELVRKHVDAGTPVLTEQWDGGLFYGYREHEGKREVWFVWDDKGQWLDIETLQPAEVCALVRKRPEQDRKTVWRKSLERAVRFASPHEIEWGDDALPQGLKALEAYLADVKDPAKDFENAGEWFCWAAFSRLCARACSAAWLERVAEAFGGQARPRLSAAAGHYRKAHGHYERFRIETGAGTPTEVPLRDRARTPERIAVVAPWLESGIEEERAGVQALQEALELIKRD